MPASQSSTKFLPVVNDSSKASITRSLALRGSSLRRPRNRQSLKIRDDDLLDVLEDVSFKKALASGVAFVAFDGVAVDVVSDVVNGVEEGGG
ncbi:hypothetical protein FGADI_4365 [Fusarium gaditjirri]|uniref:Uncharacterized protein n=1 Tax=Fusarium gaditjirri TaxID=282569 RepID=A0A8H4TD37_9HYPO|nr:hypothetical protein FGADI_4365 [Fusarium gaditjirri]